jgi:hypothetical protein
MVVVWTAPASARDVRPILLQSRTRLGEPLAEPLRVDEPPDAFNSQPRLTMDHRGRMAVVWERRGSVFVRFFAAAGTALGGEQEVAPEHDGAGKFSPVVEPLGDSLLVVWHQRNDGSGVDFYGQIIDRQGTALIAPVELATGVEWLEASRWVLAVLGRDAVLYWWHRSEPDSHWTSLERLRIRWPRG